MNAIEWCKRHGWRESELAELLDDLSQGGMLWLTVAAHGSEADEIIGVHLGGDWYE